MGTEKKSQQLGELKVVIHVFFLVGRFGFKGSAFSWQSKGTPPMVNSPLIRPYFLGGGGIGGVPLGSHDI